MTDPIADSPNILPRRHFLKILAGVPIAIGLPTLALGPLLARDEDGHAKKAVDAEAVRRAIEAARERQLMVLLIAVPSAGAGCDVDGLARRHAVAVALTGLVESAAPRTRLALGLSVIIVAPKARLGAAGRLPDAASGIWTLETSWTAGKPWPPVAVDDVDLDAATPTAVAQLERRLCAAALAKNDTRVRGLATHERSVLEADGHLAEVETALQQLASEDATARAAALATLTDRRDAIRHILAHAALAPEAPESVRVPCRALASPAARVVPLGSEWIDEAAGVPPRADPCIGCGRARIPEGLRARLRLLGG